MALIRTIALGRATGVTKAPTDNSTALATTAYADAAAGGGGGGSTFTYYDPDKPPASADTRDDEFPGSSLDAKWTWLNQGTATATVANGALRIAAPSNGGVTPSQRILYQAAPSTPFVIATHLYNHGVKDFGGGGLVVRDSGSGRILVSRIVINGTSTRYDVIATRMTNATTGSSDPFTGKGNSNTLLAIAHDGTTVHWYVSLDGVLWYEFYSETAASFLSPSGSLQVGVMADSVGTTPAHVDFSWFRCLTATSTPAFGGTRTVTGS